MKKTLLLASLAFAALGAMAQTDITPARYNFAAQEVGPYAFDEFITGANPAANYANAVEKFNDGYIVGNNGQFGNENVVNRFKSGTNIIDLPGAGKVLCIKGAASTYEYGIPMEDALPPNWFNLSFYLAPGSHAVEQKVRFRCVFRLLRNTPALDKNVLNLDAYTYRNDSYVTNFLASEEATEFDKAHGGKFWGSGDFIARYDDDNSPMEDDEGNMFYADEWQVNEFDWSAANEDGVPFRYVMHWNNENIGEYVLLVKELKVIADPEGDPVVEKIKVEADEADGIEAVEAAIKRAECYDLFGRRAQQSQSGIVIANGKKILK